MSKKVTPPLRLVCNKDVIGVNRDRIGSIAEMRKVMATKLSIIVLQVVRGNENIYLLLR